jgi:hypothetical protein
MEASVIRKLSHGALTAAAVVAVAAGGSAALAGTAFAGGHDCGCDGWHGGWGYHGSSDNDGGNGGNGGDATVNCVLPIGISAGVIGQGGDNSQCNATGGAGGDGGTGSNY